jgi:AcrR family transcriptional regulator
MVEAEKLASHRPSRRGAIVAGAIRVFARHGDADASIQAVAREAGVAPTAVYYHFSGKDDLFEAALRRIMDTLNKVTVEARADEEPGSPEALAHVITSVWRWLDANPDATALLYHHLPGTTTRAAALQREFESLHVERAFAYFAVESAPRSRQSSISKHAKETLAARAFIGLTILIHPMRAADGPLSKYSGRAICDALIDVSERIVTVD